MLACANSQVSFRQIYRLILLIKSSAEKVRKRYIFIYIYVKLALRYQFEKICTDNNEPGEQHSSLKGKKQRKSFRKVIKTSISCRKHVSVCNIFASEGSSRKTTSVQRPASQSSSVWLSALWSKNDAVFYFLNLIDVFERSIGLDCDSKLQYLGRQLSTTPTHA